MKMLNNTNTELTRMQSILSKVLQISFPYIMVVSIIGIGGNFLAIIMLSTKSLSKNFNNCTLIALAITDLIFNFTLVSRYINDLIRSNNETICFLLSFLSHLAELLSACFTAQFTAQRFIAVRFPLSVFIEKKVHLIHYFIVTIFIILGVTYCLALVKTNAYDNCYEELALGWFISDALFSFLIPFTIIALLNILIIIYLKRRYQNNQKYCFTKREQQTEILPLNNLGKGLLPYELGFNMNFHGKLYEDMHMSASRQSSIQPSSHNNDILTMSGRVRSLDVLQRPATENFKSQSYRVTRMLILVSTCFLVLNAPAHICTIGLKIYTLRQTQSVNQTQEALVNLNDNFDQSSESPAMLSNNIELGFSMRKGSSANDATTNLQSMQLFYILLVITQLISYASYSINFFLYSFCGMKFRRELIRYVSSQRRPPTKSRSIMTL